MLIELTTGESQLSVAIDPKTIIELRDVSRSPEWLNGKTGNTLVLREGYPSLLVAETFQTVMARIQGKPAGQAARTAPGAVPMRP